MSNDNPKLKPLTKELHSSYNKLKQIYFAFKNKNGDWKGYFVSLDLVQIRKRDLTEIRKHIHWLNALLSTKDGRKFQKLIQGFHFWNILSFYRKT